MATTVVVFGFGFGVTGLRPALLADEGMWLFNDLPTDHLQTKHGFTPTPAWAEHLMKASVRFNSGGSASFISSTGLVLTNHHVGADTLYKISTPEHNYYRDGFCAPTYADEIKAPDLELNQLMSIEDVTSRVKAAVTATMSPGEAAVARRAVMAEIEKESQDSTGFRSDVVTLYGGGRYHLYRYKKYTDVRLVWAPEADIAFFGGDADNFEYPRYDLDACIFRVYEDDRPAQIEHFLKWSERGLQDGELVFVSGNPGRTSRLATVAALKYQRDVRLPYLLNFIRRREILLQQFSQRSPENERRAHDDLFGVQNSRKVRTGMLQGLQDPQFMAAKEAAEQKLLDTIAQDPQLRGHAQAWETIARLQQRQAELIPQGISLNTTLFQVAQTLVRMAIEDQKPSAQRLREYRDSARESLLQQLFSPAPVYKDLEQVILGDLLAFLAEQRGGDDPLLQQILAGKSPRARAAELVQGTRLDDVQFRRDLAANGGTLLESCDDPLIQLAQLIDPESRRLREEQDAIEEEERQAYAQIAEAVFATQGTSTYPDATFTLRLAFGVVKGYEQDGQPIPPWTTLGGVFDYEQLHAATPPWKLPASWHRHRDRLDPETQFNFVCTADIIGGNSGSPVVNRELELVGVIFDGNIQSLPSDYRYDDRQDRAVSVSAQAIREALQKIYGADRIVAELDQ
ncbi:MAG: S46 family peptidase [Planctomycetaceae bacterium]|nr:S46 family peptidase [Planctomycetaceae bacterium]